MSDIYEELIIENNLIVLNSALEQLKLMNKLDVVLFFNIAKHAIMHKKPIF